MPIALVHFSNLDACTLRQHAEGSAPIRQWLHTGQARPARSALPAALSLYVPPTPLVAPGPGANRSAQHSPLLCSTLLQEYIRQRGGRQCMVSWHELQVCGACNCVLPAGGTALSNCRILKHHLPAI